MAHAKEEKKVEFLELVYDLIFVYVIGRNNALLHHVENGFVSGGSFLAYVLCTLAVIQIWNFSTFYINVYGKNGVREHVFLFVNMYLLYYIADGTGIHWQTSFYRYGIAWALILLNIGIQHLIEIPAHKNAPWEVRQLRQKAAIILTEAALVAVNIALYRITGISFAALPILFGMTAMTVFGSKQQLAPVDFAHLTERAMLYVVFTFGEMIIAIAAYFKGELNFSTIYFSVMGFLIVVGLFLGYGTVYNHILDRETETNGMGYMLIHVFLIFALNNLTAALEFMRETEVALWPKTLFLLGSFLLYFALLFALGRYARRRCRFNARFYAMLAGLLGSFGALMLLFREQMYINIALSVVYVFAVFLILYRFGRKMPDAICD